MTTPNRERLNTADSAQRHVSGGGLRERTSTVDSLRNSTDNDLTSLLHIPAATSPPASIRRISLNSPNTTTTRRRRFADWLPAALGGGNNKTTTKQQQQQPFITGLDLVYNGTAPAADAILIWGAKPPRYLWYMLSGAVCDVIQFQLDFLLLHTLLGVHDATICWAVGFLLSIVVRHSSHRYFVFGDYVGGYKASLLRMYAGYSVIIVLSTAFNYVMTRVAALSHSIAWISTLLWTGIANYFILKKLWSFGGTNNNSGTLSKPPSTPMLNKKMNGYE